MCGDVHAFFSYIFNKIYLSSLILLPSATHSFSLSLCQRSDGAAGLPLHSPEVVSHNSRSMIVAPFSFGRFDNREGICWVIKGANMPILPSAFAKPTAFVRRRLVGFRRDSPAHSVDSVRWIRTSQCGARSAGNDARRERSFFSGKNQFDSI